MSTLDAPHTFRYFHQLPLNPAVKKAVKALGFSELTPIQAQILPHTLAGQDAIGQAQTGTGKTATFLLTIIEALLKRPFSNHETRYVGEPRAVILAPTRELAQQIHDDCLELTRFCDLHSVCVMGGKDYDAQIQAIDQEYLDILIKLFIMV